MQFVPDNIRADPETYFADGYHLYALDRSDNLKKCVPHATITHFNQLVSSLSIEQLQDKCFYLLHDYGHQLNLLQRQEKEIEFAKSNYKLNQSFEMKVIMERSLQRTRLARNKTMELFDRTVTLLTLIYHHIRSVRVGTANPIKCELTDCDCGGAQ